jgi:VIT1/CCC1 family predicted Fe2+/Mn2+ transporter
VPRLSNGAVAAMHRRDKERHHAGAVGGLRAAVLGADDGILSTASLILGVAAAHGTHRSVRVAGLLAGAMSMAAGEHVSVRFQADAGDVRKSRPDLGQVACGE